MRDPLELPKRTALGVAGVQARFQLVVGHLLACRSDGGLNCCELLREFETGPSRVDHGESGLKMPRRALQALGDRGVGWVLKFAHMLSVPRAYAVDGAGFTSDAQGVAVEP